MTDEQLVQRAKSEIKNSKSIVGIKTCRELLRRFTNKLNEKKA